MATKTRAQLNADADTFLADNTAKAIKPTHVRQRIKDLADSAVLDAEVSLFARTLLDDADAATALATITAGTPLQAYSLVITDWNAAVKSGFYHSLPGSANAPAALAENYLAGIVVSLGSTSVLQTVWPASVAGEKYERAMNAGVWGAWTQTDAAFVTTSMPADRAYRRGNVLGTVSQSGGVPTGSVVERGTNVSGTYVRWADGTQICQRTDTISGDTSISQALWLLSVPVRGFSALFSGIPAVLFGSSGSGTSVVTVLYGATTAVGPGTYLGTNLQIIGGTWTITQTAIGRWF